MRHSVSLWALMCLVSGGFGCQSLQKAMLDDDCTSSRLTFWEPEADSSLPSPKQASAEALLWLKDHEAQLLAARESSSWNASDEGLAPGANRQDWNISATNVFVPELLQREYFVKRKASVDAGTERRKPLFAQAQFGVNAQRMDSLSFAEPMALGARSGPAQTMGTYEVMPGDTLGSISRKLYGTPGRWMELAHVNQLGNGSLIFPKEIIFYMKDPQTISRH